MPCSFQSRVILPLFLFIVCAAKGEPISLSVALEGTGISFEGSASTLISASAPATILITVGSSGSGFTCSPPFHDCPDLSQDLDFAPLGGGQGPTDPAHASWSLLAFGSFFETPMGYCAGVFGPQPFDFSCTESIAPGLYSFDISFAVGFSSVISGMASFEGTVTLISGGPIAETPEPGSLILCATGSGLVIAIASISKARKGGTGERGRWFSD